MGWSRMSGLAIDAAHAHETHVRWIGKNLTPHYREILAGADDDIDHQCGGCRFYLCLEGSTGSDWGACSNPASPFDGTLKFEHDGCSYHEYGDEEATPERLAWLEAQARIVADELAEVRAELEGA